MGRRTGDHTTEMSEAEYEMFSSGMEPELAGSLGEAARRWPGHTIIKIGHDGARRRAPYGATRSAFAVQIAREVGWEVYPA